MDEWMNVLNIYLFSENNIINHSQIDLLINLGKNQGSEWVNKWNNYLFINYFDSFIEDMMNNECIDELFLKKWINERKLY